VTVGAGFIGTSLTRRLAGLGSELHVIDNLSTGVKENITRYCTTLEVAEVTSISESKLNQLGDVDVVFHLAAPSSDVTFRENPVGCLSDVLTGFAQVVKFAEAHHASKLVYATSSSVYGDSKPPQSETTPLSPTNLYGVGKLICEEIASLRPEVPSLGLRIFAGYGPGELPKGRIASVITLFMQSLLKREPITLFGDGSQTRDFVYIDDVVECMIRAAEVPDVGIINVGSGEAHAFAEVVEYLERLLGVAGKVGFAPTPPGYFASTQADITKMKSQLGVLPRGLHDGLKSYLETTRKTAL
jgi:UDP-glucose 4-epimerase